MLEASSITADVARERGYVTADTKAALAARGFGTNQQRPPALVIPLFDVWGQPAGFQCRPEEPRSVDGRITKYETPNKQPMVLDCHPRTRARLGDPDRVLIVTEGIKKADAAVSAGLDALAVLGVWNWRGTNDKGGRVALAGWEAVAAGRRVLVAYDSDSMVNPNVAGALDRLGVFLTARGFDVGYVYLPAGAGGSKVGLDDYLHAGHTVDDVLALVRPEPRLPEPIVTAPAEDDYHDIPDEPGFVVLDDLVGFCRRFLSVPAITYIDVMTLWAAHTHAIGECWTSPRLVIKSAEKQSGKTRVFELLSLFARRAEAVINMSPAYMYRAIEEDQPTLLVDEYDAIFGPKAKSDHEDLRAIINAGYRDGATVGRMVGEGANMRPVRFKTFCPVALAGLHDLPDTIVDRAVVLTMRKRAPDELIEAFRFREVRDEGELLRRRLAAWTSRHADELAGYPDMPPGITDRPADVWEPLLIVADVAGGDWPDRARAACTSLQTARAEADTSTGLMLLADIRRVFDDAKTDRLSSADLANKLAAIEEAPWGDWYGRPVDARWLAKTLRPFDIAPRQIRLGDSTLKGYSRESFGEAWRRWLSDETPTPDPSPGAKTSETRETRETEQVAPTRHVSDVSDVSDNSGTGEGSGVWDDLDPDDDFDPEEFRRALGITETEWPV
jgi:hypothetical protein